MIGSLYFLAKIMSLKTHDLHELERELRNPKRRRDPVAELLMEEERPKVRFKEDEEEKQLQSAKIKSLESKVEVLQAKLQEEKIKANRVSNHDEESRKQLHQ